MSKAYKTFAYIVLILMAASMLVPFLWMVSASFQSDNQIFSGGINFIPSPFVTSNYSEVTGTLPVGRYFFNSLFVAITTTVFQVAISAMAGFAFAKFKFGFKEIIFIFVLVTMMIPPQVNIIPLFFMMREFGWINTYQGLIIPGIFGAFGIFMMRQWFVSMPDSLIESAKIDGCSMLKIFFKIALPLALPAVVTLSIFSFVSMYNSFMWPLIITNSDLLRTLPVALASFKGSFRDTIEWGQMLALCVLSLLPVLAVFFAGKKYFINDILSGGVKE